MDRDDTRARLDSIRSLVGHTPLIRIDLELDGAPCAVCAKVEFFSLTGSIKDRMAAHILSEAYDRGELVDGAPIAEATSGNTGISFAAMGRALGHPVTVYMPERMSPERRQLLAGLGAEVRLVREHEGGFADCVRLAEEYALAHPGCLLPRQFSNPDNARAHEATTGPELLAQLDSAGLGLDAFVAGVGTGGTIMGVAACLRERGVDAGLHPVEPTDAPVLSTGASEGHHRIQGIADDFVPELLDLDVLDDIIGVHSGDAILMAQRLGRELGLGVGISSGANVVAAAVTSARLGSGAAVATVLCDDNKKYLSTDLMREEPEDVCHVSPRLRLVGWTTLAAGRAR
jgi:cysteine synthase A